MVFTLRLKTIRICRTEFLSLGLLTIFSLIILPEAGKSADVFTRTKTNPVISPAVYALPGDVVKVWVKLTDKGLYSSGEVDKALRRAGISERALKRRAKNNAGLDFGDIPVADKYKEALGRFGAVCVESRWFNSVSLEVDKNRLKEIAELPFTAEISPVSKGRYAGYEDWNTGIQWKGDDIDADFDGLNGHEGSFYGVSYDQLDQIGVIEAHRRGFYGANVVVAVLDGGFMTDHRSLIHADVLDEWDFINDDDFTGYDAAQDLRGQPNHGTACMSNIGAYDPGNLIGCAPNASFLLAKTENIRSETAVEEDYWAAAVEWAEREGADVLSSSLSYLDWYSPAEFDGETAICTQAANRAFELGLVTVSSMGNSGPRPMTMGTPSDAEGNVTVGAVDSLGVVTGFSSRGPTADGRIKPNVCAMGRHVTVATPYTWDGYGLANGTSFSCPLAAGAIALLREAHPEWSSWEVLEAVENTATQAECPDNDYGYGILQIDKAMDYPCISGVVRDKDSGKPISGAQVIISAVEMAGLTIADDGGFYKIANLPRGKYRIKAVYPGYIESEERIITAPPDEYCDFSLVSQ